MRPQVNARQRRSNLVLVRSVFARLRATCVSEDAFLRTCQEIVEAHPPKRDVTPERVAERALWHARRLGVVRDTPRGCRFHDPRQGRRA